MSSIRKRLTRHHRWLAQVRRCHLALKLTSVRNGPYRTQVEPGGGEVLFFEGAERVVRNGAGEVVLSDKAHDFVLDRVTYGRIMSARPGPLSRRQRAKANR